MATSVEHPIERLEERWRSLKKDDIILKYAPLVKYVVGRMTLRLPPTMDQEDLIQAGILGLIDAVDRFDPTRGIRFNTYAEFRVRGAVLDELRAMDWVPRTVRQTASQLESAFHALEQQLGRPADDAEVATHLGVSLEEFYEQLESVRTISIVSFDDLRPMVDDDERDVLEMLADPTVEDPVEAIGLKEVRKALAAAIDSLPNKERLVVALYYFEELTMAEIGAVLGVTESRISQLHSKAALRMRARVRKVMGMPG